MKALNSFLCIYLFSTTSLLGQTVAKAKNEQAPSNEVLVVNGKEIGGKLIRNNERVYVAVEDLARGLDGQISFSRDKIILNIGSPASKGNALSETEPKPEATQLGKVRGTLTYFFNTNFGQRPESGATVYLVADWFEMADSEVEVGWINWKKPGGWQNTTGSFRVAAVEVVNQGSQALSTRVFNLIKQTTTDGNGNYQFDSLSPGKYTVVCRSSHAHGKFILGNATGARDWGGYVRTTQIDVHPGNIIDVSENFPASY